MRVFYWSGVLLSAAVLLNACTIGDSTPTADSNTSSPSPVAASPPATTQTPATSPATNTKSAVKVTPDAKKPLFNKAFVVTQNVVAGLINTTDKLQRQDALSKKVNTVTNRKRDPFDALPGTLPPLPVAPNQTKSVVLPNPATRVVVKPPVAPPPPDPTEAKSINVTGVMEMDGTQYAIVNIPGEPTTRYVKVGQRLINNQVLVKRIETAGTPTVIFQQFNVEVPRPVGLVAAAIPSPNAPNAAPNASTTPTNTGATPTGVILPPAPTATTPVAPNTVNTPIVTPAGVTPVPSLVLPKQ